MRLFTLEPGAESSIHSHPWCHWFMCIKGEGYFLIDKERVPLEFGHLGAHPRRRAPQLRQHRRRRADGPLHRTPPRET